MAFRIKQHIKKLLAWFGLYDPAFKAKISQASKAKIIIENKTPELKIFVETGTRQGDMIEMVGKHFQTIYSIELDKELYKKACERFAHQDQINLIEGDSGVKIHEVLEKLHEPALFWLDAHGDTVVVVGPNAAPIKKELEAIFSHPIKKHVILIDDARHFNSEGISIVKNLAKINGFKFVVRDGLFILTPNRSNNH